jgi:hypothetical protein
LSRLEQTLEAAAEHADDFVVIDTPGKSNSEARHEAASVIAACASGLLSEARDRDLVLHLIGTHHGCGRPLFPIWKDEPGFMVLAEAEGKSFETQKA